MMQMLEAGGVPLLVDDARPADADNPNGYAEYAPVMASARDVSWFDAAPGRAVKVIHELLRCLPDDGDLRIVLMERDLGEVVRSQRRMLGRSATAADADEARVVAIFAEQLREARRWAAARPRTALLAIDYRDVVVDPVRAAQRVDVFLGGGLDVVAMAARVDRGLYRNR